jgi:hypothetical protein
MAAPLQTLVAHPDDTSDEARRSAVRDAFPLPDADMVTAVWADRPPGGWSPGHPDRPDKAKSLSRGMLALGAGLLLFVPVGGALFLAAGVLGLAIASEAPPSPTNQ